MSIQTRPEGPDASLPGEPGPWCSFRDRDEYPGAEGTTTEYLHCGEPMQPKDTSTVSIFEPVFTDPEGTAAPDVQLDTTVLRCRCGFQISVPA